MDIAKAFAGLIDQSPKTQMAPVMGAAPASNPFVTALSNPNVYMGLLTGGLSALSSGDLGQGINQGMGIYQQLLNNQVREEQSKAQAEENKARLGLSERQVGVQEKGAKLDEDRLDFDREKEENRKREEAARLAAQKAIEEKRLSAKDAKAPSGADSKLWSEALDTVIAINPEGTVSLDQVYEVYNSMAPDGQGILTKQQLYGMAWNVAQRPETAQAAADYIENAFGKPARIRFEAVLKQGFPKGMPEEAKPGEGKGGKEKTSSILGKPLTPEQSAEADKNQALLGQGLNPLNNLKMLEQAMQFPSVIQFPGALNNMQELIYDNYPFTTLQK